ncbi:hypothetical protein BDP27DRAFT_1321449 [Rhodocollybia butyracea]|uniref:Uncharacterized protein n=1 Tax=Rhodocollybia butyracea TaxID=206335 RepID=A0A9P5PYY3_9AGAR|nr:hypothetical protein BDP27DRAFT_1321449 [Rhodocollybia butyracea]
MRMSSRTIRSMSSASCVLYRRYTRIAWNIRVNAAGTGLSAPRTGTLSHNKNQTLLIFEAITRILSSELEPEMEDFAMICSTFNLSRSASSLLPQTLLLFFLRINRRVWLLLTPGAGMSSFQNTVVFLCRLGQNLICYSTYVCCSAPVLFFAYNVVTYRIQRL